MIETVSIVKKYLNYASQSLNLPILIKSIKNVSIVELLNMSQQDFSRSAQEYCSRMV